MKPVLQPDQKRALETLSQRIRPMLGDDLIMLRLFGSRARGDAESHSDMDVALIVRGLSPERRRQILDEVAEIELELLVPVSLMLLSERAFQRLKSRQRRLVRDVENEGIPF